MIPAIQRDRSDSDRHLNAAYHFRHRALTLYQRTLKLVICYRLKLARPTSIGKEAPMSADYPK
jgi:hypothetical protein